MKKRIHVKPGKAQSTMGFVVGLIFCCIGLFVAIPTFGVFGIFWTLIAVVITVMHGMNVFSDKGPATQYIEVETQEDTDSYESASSHGGWNGSSQASTSAGQPQANSIEERLEQLNRLYDQRLITKEEFDAKKAAILEEL